MKNLNWFLNKKLLLKDETIINIAENYLEKARNNIITMELLSNSINFRKELKLPSEYEPDEWVVIVGYYSMYLAASSVLAKVGYKSKNHSATIKALEEFFVEKKMLEKEYLKTLEKIKINKEEILKLDKVKDRREIAQYSVTKETTQQLATKTKQDAHMFVDKMEELFDSIE